MDPYESLERVKDRATFLDFVQALIDDRRDEVAKGSEQPFGHGANGWENGTIEGYLDAALAWAKDSLGQENGLPEQPSWQAFATFLYVGKIYE